LPEIKNWLGKIPIITLLNQAVLVPYLETLLLNSIQQLKISIPLLKSVDYLIGNFYLDSSKKYISWLEKRNFIRISGK